MTTTADRGAPERPQAAQPPAPWSVRTRSEEETRRFGERLGALAPAGAVVLLSGPLGAGKTVLAQGVARGLAVSTTVNSPSFVLVNEHRGGRIPFFHADLYRLEGAAEVEELFLDEIAAEGLLVVEWPERALPVLPANHLRIRLRPGPGDTERTLESAAFGPEAAALLRALRAARARPAPDAPVH